MKKYNVKSFELDHTKVKAPYIRVADKTIGKKGDVVKKFDIRVCQPNKECLSTGVIHTLEHLIAEYLRDEINDVIDFSPMGCRTGFYLTVFGSAKCKDIYKSLKKILKKIIKWEDEIPAKNEKECGNYIDHDLIGAKLTAKKWLVQLKEKGYKCNE